MFAKLKLRQRILLGYLSPLLLMLGAMVLVFVNLQKNVQLTTEHDHALQVLSITDDAMQSLLKLQVATRGYMLHKNPVSLKLIQESLSDYQSNMEHLRLIVTDAQQQEMLRSFDQKGKDLVATLKTEFDLVDAGKTAAAVKIFSSREISESKALQESWGRVDQRGDELAKMLNANEESAMSVVRNSIIYGMLGAIALAVIIALWLARAISRNITASVTQLSAASSEIAATVAQHERTASQQAAAVTETSATIDELSASSRQTAEQAANSAALAERSSSATTEGSDATQQAVLAMNSLKDKIGAMADQILHLGEQTGQIGSIATLLKDLAGQINMLALNAAVEAARAGEHGKGFAVVASEIRKLVDQSKKSAEQTAVLVADIQKATNSSIMVTEDGTRTVTEVTQLVRKVNELFGNLASLANSVNENSQQMMLNTKQQSAAFSQVVQATNNISAGAKETAAGIGQTKIGVQNLNNAAENLKAIV
jgi:methyl-accepting chemotaxis protein